MIHLLSTPVPIGTMFYNNSFMLSTTYQHNELRVAFNKSPVENWRWGGGGSQGGLPALNTELISN